MIPDNETRLEADLTALENMQEARRANWHAEEARIQSKLEARRANWHVEEAGRTAKIAALRSRLSIKREIRFAQEAKAEADRVKQAAGKAQHDAFMTKAQADHDAAVAARTPPALLVPRKGPAPPY